MLKIALRRTLSIFQVSHTVHIRTLICDAQVHLWHSSKIQKWTADGPEAMSDVHQRSLLIDHKGGSLTSFSADDCLAEMDKAGVDKAIIVPPSWTGYDNNVAISAARNHQSRFAVMGRVNLNDVSNTQRKLTDWRSTTGMLGVRLALHRQPYVSFLESNSDWFWQAAEINDIPVYVFVVEEGHLKILGKVAKQHPNLRLVIDHLAIDNWRIRSCTELERSLQSLLQLAIYPNIAVKATALPCAISQEYPFPGLQHAIHSIVKTFGAQRVFWGTDLTRLPCTYSDAVNHFRVHLPFLSNKEKELVMGKALLKWLGWN